MQVSTLWQSENHSAFTDLSFFNGQWFCVFREGSTHMSLDGQIVVLCSNDAKTWQEHSRLSWQGGDLRDPKLSIRPDNQLILSAGIRWAVYSSAPSRLYSVAWQLEQSSEQSFEQNHWSAPILDDTSEGTWRWAVTWHQGKAYSVGYGGQDIHGCLYRSDDGLHWQKWVEDFFPDPSIFTNESSLVSQGDSLICLSRRDAAGGANAVLGISTGRLKTWHWKLLAKPIGGPKLMQLSNGEFVVVGRYINFKRWSAKTRLYKLNNHTGRLKLWRELPSAGDTSYAGMIEYDGQLYISYYSCHQHSHTAIYLARIALHTKKRSKRFA